MNVINLEGAKWFIENYVKHKITDCYRNPKLCEDLEKTIKQLNDLKVTVTKLIKEVEDMLKIVRGKKELTTTEIITIALAQRPIAPESVKRKAQEIIYRYRLTPEEVNRIYRSVYGEW